MFLIQPTLLIILDLNFFLFLTCFFPYYFQLFEIYWCITFSTSKVINKMIWYVYLLQNDYHSKIS